RRQGAVGRRRLLHDQTHICAPHAPWRRRGRGDVARRHAARVRPRDRLLARGGSSTAWQPGTGSLPGHSEYRARAGFPAWPDHAAFHVLIARVGGENVATAMAFDRDGHGGIYNVTTLERARRRGLGTALIVVHVHDA